MNTATYLSASSPKINRLTPGAAAGWSALVEETARDPLLVLCRHRDVLW